MYSKEPKWAEYLNPPLNFTRGFLSANDSDSSDPSFLANHVADFERKIFQKRFFPFKNGPLLFRHLKIECELWAGEKKADKVCPYLSIFFIENRASTVFLMKASLMQKKKLGNPMISSLTD